MCDLKFEVWTDFLVLLKWGTTRSTETTIYVEAGPVSSSIHGLASLPSTIHDTAQAEAGAGAAFTEYLQVIRPGWRPLHHGPDSRSFGELFSNLCLRRWLLPTNKVKTTYRCDYEQSNIWNFKRRGPRSKTVFQGFLRSFKVFQSLVLPQSSKVLSLTTSLNCLIHFYKRS